MQFIKVVAVGFLLPAIAISVAIPSKIAVGSSKFTEPNLIAQGRWGFIKKAGKLIFMTAGGAFIEGAASEAGSATVGGINDRNRLEELAQSIHQEEYAYYTQFGQPIPVNDQNVNILMSRVGALPAEQGYVINRMNLYWGR
jgi:hypothetical protein